jgi:hypothetical protein
METLMTTTRSPVEKIPFRIHLLRAANPITMKLLASRLHFVLSRDLLVAKFRGRKSGGQFAAPLSYVEVGNRLYLCTRPEVANWWKNMRGGVGVEIIWRGRPTRAHAAVLDSASDEAESGFRTFLSHNPSTASMLYHVEIGKGGEPKNEDVLRELQQSVIVRIEPELQREIVRM